MQAAVSTSCLYPMKTEDAVFTLAKLGIPNIEIFFNSFEEATPAFLARIQNIVQQHHMKVVALHPFTSAFEPLLFFSDYERRFEEGIALYSTFFKACQFLGAPLLVFHGDFAQSLVPAQNYFRRFETLRTRAMDYGVLLAQENVARCKSGKAAFIAQMADALPQARFVLDSKQALRAGEDFDQMRAAMGDKIVHLHVSDHKGEEDCLLPGEGEMDFTQFVAKFSPWFTGYSVIEVYRHNFNDPMQLFKSNNFLVKILETQK